MTQTPSLPVVGHLTADQAPDPDGTKIYAPRWASQLRFGFFLICISLFGLLPLKGILDWLSGGPVPNAETFFALVFLLILPICMLAILILNALRGLPRLTITPQGVTLKSSVGTKWANWDSIDSFVIKAVHAGRFRNRLTVTQISYGNVWRNNRQWIPLAAQMRMPRLVRHLARSPNLVRDALKCDIAYPHNLPAGQITCAFAHRSPAPSQKIFRLTRRANRGYDSRRLAPTRGALRGRHGRWVRDAVDVEVPLTNGTDADGEVVWS
jgi:hypothetical protein